MCHFRSIPLQLACGSDNCVPDHAPLPKGLPLSSVDFDGDEWNVDFFNYEAQADPLAELIRLGENSENAATKNDDSTKARPATKPTDETTVASILQEAANSKPNDGTDPRRPVGSSTIIRTGTGRKNSIDKPTSPPQNET